MERERIENGIRSISFKAGIKRGLEQGNVEKQTSIISTMLGNGISQEEISRMTGIPIKEVNAIKL